MTSAEIEYRKGWMDGIKDGEDNMKSRILYMIEMGLINTMPQLKDFLLKTD